MSRENETNELDDKELEPGDDAAAKRRADFLDALRDRETVLPVPDVGQRLHAKLVSIGDETSFLDYGGRSEAIMETRHLRDAEGAPLAKEGDTVEAYVIANEEGVVLAPAFTPGPDEALQVLREAEVGCGQRKVKGLNAGGPISTSRRARSAVSQIDLGYCPDASPVGKSLISGDHRRGGAESSFPGRSPPAAGESGRLMKPRARKDRWRGGPHGSSGHL
jgi:hypothetical protein